MLVYSEGFHEGYHCLLHDIGPYAFVNMEVGMVKLEPGSTFKLYEEEKETALLMLTGGAEYRFGGRTVFAGRTSVFKELPFCLHVPRKVNLVISAVSDCEIYVQKTYNETSFEPVFYTPADIQSAKAGTGDVLGGCMRRNIRTVFDYENAPYSNMVLGEVVNFPGKWSSYPPHYHPQPEVYFYKFDHPQGFGAAFIGEKAFTIRHNSLAVIRENVSHPQAAAPGYAMFYVWGIRHLDGDPWRKTRIDAPEHAWLLDPDVKILSETEQEGNA